MERFSTSLDVSAVPSFISQSFFPSRPIFTEKNFPNQSGRVYLITGGYGGIGYELTKILYQHNAKIYIAGRSESKALTAISHLQSLFPSSSGSLHPITLDLSDLTTIPPALSPLLTTEPHLDVLVLNAGIAFTPPTSKSPQGINTQLTVNCLASTLIYHTLHPLLLASPHQPRVLWASSIVADLQSPSPGGIAWTRRGGEWWPDEELHPQTQYAQTKAGNLLLAGYYGGGEGVVVHVAFHPGNLRTGLQRHMGGWMRGLVHWGLCYDVRWGAYTELFAAVGDVGVGGYVVPWGRMGEVVRKDVRDVMGDDGEEGLKVRWVRWVEGRIKEFMPS